MNEIRSIAKERIELDLELLCVDLMTASHISLFQNLINEVIAFDDALSKQWMIDLQETPLLLSIIQESDYFEKWLLLDSNLYLSCIQSDVVSEEVLIIC